MIAKSMIGVINGKLKTADLLTFLILTKVIPMYVVILRVGSKILLKISDLMELELTLSQKYQKIFGLNMVKQLVFSKWENALMGTQITSLNIKALSVLFSTTQCILQLRMFLVLKKQCIISKIASLKSKENSKMLML